MERMKKNEGFSLVELIVVLAIMAVLVGILSPTFLRYVEKARAKKDAHAVGEFINELYLAASDLDNWNGISGNLTFTYDSANKVLKTTPDEGANDFSNEVASVVGGDIKLESQEWQTAGNEGLTIIVSPVWDTVHVTSPSGIMGEYEFNHVTVTNTP